MGTFLGFPFRSGGLGIHIAMLIGAAITAFGSVVGVIRAPETKDRPLSETSARTARCPATSPHR